MRRIRYVLLALCIVFPFFSTATAQQQPETVLYDVVFEVAPGVNPTSHATGLMAQLGIDNLDYPDRLRFVYTHAINGYALALTPWEIGEAERLLSSGNVMGVQSITPSVAFSAEPVEVMQATGQSESPLKERQVVPVGVTRVAGVPTNAPNVNVAVIDTGVDRSHPDLRVVGGIDCVDPNNPWGIDENGHGTIVAGEIGALDNDIGVVGVAPGANIYSVRVLDAGGSGSIATVLCGIEWVAAQEGKMHVANMSLGAPVPVTDACGGSDPMRNGICVASHYTTFVVAAGNSTKPVSNHIPAGYDEVVTVSAYTDYDGVGGGFALTPAANCTAMSVDDELATFSNYGQGVNYTAPGVCVLSTYLDGEYAYASGTSMASPYVAGCFARYLNENPDQMEFADQQLRTFSVARGDDVLMGDHDGIPEPLISCEDIPRYVGN